jgi:hypothetical protein
VAGGAEVEKEKIVTSENSIYIDGLRLYERLLDRAEELANSGMMGEFSGMMKAINIVSRECSVAALKQEKQNETETV